METDWACGWNAVLAISTLVMALAIIITAVFAIIQLNHIKRARYSDLLMRFDQIWDSEEFRRSRHFINSNAKGATLKESSICLKEILIPLDEGDSPKYYDTIIIANFFESLGRLACMEYMKKDDVIEMYGSAARRYWELFSEFTQYLRFESKRNTPSAWICFECLATQSFDHSKCKTGLKNNKPSLK